MLLNSLLGREITGGSMQCSRIATVIPIDSSSTCIELDTIGLTRATLAATWISSKPHRLTCRRAGRLWLWLRLRVGRCLVFLLGPGHMAVLLDVLHGFETADGIMQCMRVATVIPIDSSSTCCIKFDTIRLAGATLTAARSSSIPHRLTCCWAGSIRCLLKHIGEPTKAWNFVSLSDVVTQGSCSECDECDDGCLHSSYQVC